MLNIFKNLDKRSKILLEVIVISLFVAVGSTSWAFFSISGVPQGKDNIVTTGSMRLEFDDGQEINTSDLTPGHSVVKSFKIKNIGSLETVYDIYLSEVVNTFVDKDDLVYTVISESGCQTLDETTVPSESGAAIINNCTITPNQEHEYILNIEFKETNDNQNDNASKIFSAKLSVNEFNAADGLTAANAYIEEANKFYALNPNSESLGSDVVDVLEVSDKVFDDKVVITRSGNVELAIKRDEVCFRKYSTSDEIKVLDSVLCDVDITKFASNNGRLHITGSKLMNEYNEEIRLTGASHGNGGLNKQQREYSLESLDTLRSWGGNLFRLFIDGKSKYSSMYNYIGNEDDYISTLSNAIDNAIASDMYVLIVWAPHASNASDPLKTNAIDAFTRVANLYPNDPHIIYEIWNEPGTSSWTAIKNYANDVIPQIRAISPDSIVVVGTPSNDSGIDGPVGDEITLGNVMYTSHIYAGTFSGTYNDKLINAINNGLPVFETEMAGTETGETTNDLVYEAQISALASILNKYNISYAFFVWHSTNWSYGITHKTWNEKLPDHLLSNNGKFFKRMLRDDFYYNVKLLEEQMTASDYRTAEWRDKIVSVSFVEGTDIPSTAVQTWDVSFAKDNSIIGYLLPTDTADMYDLVIAANGKIAGSLNSRALFSGMSNVKSFDFSNFITDNVNNTAYMFYNNKNLLNLDLTTFNVNTLTTISYMFNGCEKLQTLNISNWQIKPTAMNSTFNGLKAVEELDLRGIDVSDLSDFRYAFNVDAKLKKLNISTWNPKNVTDISYMFNALYAAEEVDMRNFDIPSSAVVTGALNNVKKNTKFIVKSQDVANILAPTSTNEVTFEVR